MAALLDKAGVDNPATYFRSGDEAIEYLQRRYLAARGETLSAGLMFLDVKMPRMSGFEVLAWVRAQSPLDHLVVVMLSTSDDEQDIASALQRGACTYLLKFPTALSLAALVREVEASQHSSG